MSENLPVQWQEELARQAKEVAALERPSVAMISLRSGVMKYQDQQVPGNKLSVIVIASAFEHRWFKNRWNPDVKENPACFALSATGKDMVPHPDSTDIQSEQCLTCPQFEWGSAEQGKGKACKSVRRLALLPVSSDPDYDYANAEMALLTVPVTSAKNWANYVNRVAAEYERPPWAVVTEISVHPHPKNQFEIKFTSEGLLNDSVLAELFKRVGPAQEILLTPYEPLPEQAPPEEEPKGKKKKY